MKKVLALCLALSLLLCGCTWLDGEYHSVTPHASDNSQQSQDGVVVSGYIELRDAMVDMVAAGVQERTFYIVDIEQEKLEQSMNTAIMHVCKSTAIGAYAVQEITYELGMVGGQQAVAIDVSYVHGRQEIMRIKKVQTMNSVKTLLGSALTSYSPSVVIQVEDYDGMDVAQYIKDYVDANPHTCMEMPQLAISIYPETGSNRILEIGFTYQTSRDTLRTMQETVAPIFSAAKMYVQDSESNRQKYERLHSFLMERFDDYKIETSITPTYSLLRYGVGDSRAFASVYSVMCNNAGIFCQVVSGTHNGEAWYWNYVKIDDTYYHVDLLAGAAGEFTPMLQEDMAGYVWDYSQFQ